MVRDRQCDPSAHKFKKRSIIQSSKVLYKVDTFAWLSFFTARRVRDGCCDDYTYQPTPVLYKTNFSGSLLLGIFL